METSLRICINMLLIIGTCSLIYWPRAYHEGFFIPLRYELVYTVASFCFGLYFLSQLIRGRVSFDKEDRNIGIALSVLLISVLFATLFSFIRYNLAFNLVGVASLLKILLGVTTFTTIYYILKNELSNTNYKLLSWALILPSSTLIPFVFFPDVAKILGFVTAAQGYRFMGLTVNPCAMDMIVIVAFAYSYSLLMFNFIKRGTLLLTIVYSILTVGFSALIFWSQSRSFCIAMFLIVSLVSIIYGFYFKNTVWKKIISLLIGMGLTLSGILFIPAMAKYFFIYGKILGVSADQMQQDRNVAIRAKESNRSLQTGKANIELINTTKINGRKKYHLSDTDIVKYMKKDPRVMMWKYNFSMILNYPFGVGVNYQPRFSYKWMNYFLPPVFLFNVWAWGGIFAFLSICYLLWKPFLTFKNELLINSELIPYHVGAVTSIIISCFISLFYGLPLDYLGFWVVLALAIV